MARPKKKLIEVALPLKEINEASAREKSIRHGHPSTLHLWWARRPLAACRAVLFASLVDDPSEHPDRFRTERAQKAERERLFNIIKQLVQWENSNNEFVLEQAREEIRKSTGGNPPPVLDPFCGGGSIPLEAQRLGLEAYASDLNPVAVLITKALIEIPPKFRDHPPVNPEARSRIGGGGNWRGARGLAEDVRYYGRWMREQAWKRIGHLYPKVKLPPEQGGGEATVIAWLWARTVKCPNPACGAQMPLVRSFVLSTKQKVWVEPVVDRRAKRVEFRVRKGRGVPEGTVNRRGARCVVCESPVPFDYIRAEGKAGRMDAQLMAIVSEAAHGRNYLPPCADHREKAAAAEPQDFPETSLPTQALGFRVQLYGMTKHRDLFTPRQLVALTTFSDLVGEARKKVLADGGSEDYANAVATYLAFALDKCADYWNTIASWAQSGEFIRNCFARQAIPMVWDYAETNPFSNSTANLGAAIEWVARVVEDLLLREVSGKTRQLDATTAVDGVSQPLVCTDPPYYDNIGYADLADFFYVWLRRSLKDVYPDLFRTLLTPKAEELVATPYRFGGNKRKAEQFFEEGLRQAFRRMHEAHHPDYPLTLFYAFKQAETGVELDLKGDDLTILVSTGWETMLNGLLDAGFQITGTWPVRSERSARSVALGTNALASSVVLVCRPRPADAPKTTRTEFMRALRKELPAALGTLREGNIAPVDLAQAAIGPGMAVFSRYAAVIEADGSPMRVRTALALINQVLEETLAEQEAELDADTRWAVAWFEQHGFEEGPFGDAETLSKAKDVSVAGLEEAGILAARRGKVRLLRKEELDADWQPETDARLTAWEAAHHLIRRIDEGEEKAGELVARLPAGVQEALPGLAYRLHAIASRRRMAKEAQDYNLLVVLWPRLAEIASQAEQMEM